MGEASARDVVIPAGGESLDGTLDVPGAARGTVMFAHGSGSDRTSPRNQVVARELQEAGFVTLLMDLLTPNERRRDAITRELRFDVELLGSRLVAAVDWADRQHETEGLPIGLFGASTGAAAALIAAAERAERVSAVVSRGGRPDLAKRVLADVRAPTLLIVGSLDGPVIDMNRAAAARLRCPHRVRIVPGATHLFEEPGKLEEAARLTRDWFLEHVRAA